MSLIGLIIVLVIIGIVLQLIKEYVEPKIYLVAIIAIILVACFFILQAFGVTSWGPHLR